MKKIEIPLKPRTAKAMLYLFSGFFTICITIGAIVNLTKKFEWFVAIIGGVTLIVSIVAIKGMMEYFNHKGVSLIAETDGKIMRFFCISSSGKVFNKTDDIKTDGIQRMYIKVQSTRYLLKNYDFEYEKGGLLSKEEIDAFPSLFDATQSEMQSVLAFIHESNPHIALGYKNIFQKLTNK